MKTDPKSRINSGSPPAFRKAASDPIETVAPGIRRQMLSHGPALMLCRVSFDRGAAGDLHNHPHSQVSYVESGRFRISIGGCCDELGPGDSCYVEPNALHSATCLEAGVLIDVFSPERTDFLPSGEGA